MGKDYILVECAKCDGKGYVIDRMAAALTMGFSAVMAWLEDDKNSLGNKKCNACNGHGRLKLRTDIL